MLSIVVAASENNVIGKSGDIPWRLSTDLRRFKLFTEGHTVVMGRKTFDSIALRLGGPLPRRHNVVITRNTRWSYPSVEISGAGFFASLPDTDEEIFAIGGSAIYALALPYAKIIHLTRVHTWAEGDAFFPSPTHPSWELTGAEYHPTSAKDEYPFTFLTYARL